MKGTKFLSEAVHLDDLKADKINIIKAPTGSGKTHFALNTIAEKCKNAFFDAVYLIDTTNGKEQINDKYENASLEPRGWVKRIESGECAWGEEWKPVVVITYFRAAKILEAHPDFFHRFKYVICDELHSLNDFYWISNITKEDYGRVTQEIKALALDKNVNVLALTATPNKVLKEIGDLCHIVKVDEDVRQWETKEIIYHTPNQKITYDTNPNQTIIHFTKHITEMQNVEKEYKARDERFHPICVWSMNNANHDMTEEQLQVREEIIRRQRIPEEYNVLIINSSCGTSIKIESHVDVMIICDADEDIQIQVRGRYNNDLALMYAYTQNIDLLSIPEGYLNKPLSSEEREELCSKMAFANEDGRPYKWTKLKQKINISERYQCVEKRKNNKRYYTITLKGEVAAE